MKLPLTSQILLACAVVCVLLCPGSPEAWAQSCSNFEFLPTSIVDLTNNNPPFSPEQYVQCEMQPGANCSALAPKTAQPPVQSQYATMIANAINSGPPDLKTQLCTVNHIYIDPTGQNTAWGMLEFTTISPTVRQYTGNQIGISGPLLANLARQNTPLEAYETNVVRALLTPPASQPPPPPLPSTAAAWIQGVTYSGAATDNITVAILGILAHEMGHIIYVSQIQNAITAYPKCPRANRFFYSYSWGRAGYNFRYHRFGEPDSQNRPPSGPTLPEIWARLQENDLTKATEYLSRIYSGHEWASLFATVSVDEDFVETYMLHALNRWNFLPTLPITIPGVAQPIDVMLGFGIPNSILAQKAGWIDRCIPLNYLPR